MNNGTWAVQYHQRVLASNPIAYWVLDEKYGTVAYDWVAENGTQNGDHTGGALVQPGIGDGRSCLLYNGATDYTSVQTAAFAAAFSGAAGSLMIWGSVSGAGVWTDGSQRDACIIYTDANNYILIARRFSNNDLIFRYYANATNDEVILGSLSTLDWMQLALTWDAAAGGTGEVKAYYNGAQTGATQVGLGVWAGAPTVCAIGAGDHVPNLVWSGRLSNCIVWDRALPSEEVSDFYVVQ